MIREMAGNRTKELKIKNNKSISHTKNDRVNVSNGGTQTT